MSIRNSSPLSRIVLVFSIAITAPLLLAQDSKYDPRPDSRARFVDKGEYVIDTKTGLHWQKDGEASGKKNFYEAAEYAKSLKLGGKRGWRVPTKEELAEIFPADQAPFTKTGYNPAKCCEGPVEFRSYWTSNLDGSVEDYAFVYQWYDKGGANNCVASRNFVNVRCVRGKVGGASAPGKTTAEKIADLLKNVGHEDRSVSTEAMLELRKLGQEATSAIREEADRTKRKLLELEILLGEPARPR